MDESDHLARLLDVREEDAGKRLRKVGEEGRVARRRRNEVGDYRKRVRLVERTQQVAYPPAWDLLVGWHPVHTSDRLRRPQHAGTASALRKANVPGCPEAETLRE